MSITELPTELVNHIITIGCEELPHAYSHLTDFKPRRLKRFAGTASAVCRDWRRIVLSPSNYDLWSTELVLSYGVLTRDTWYSSDIATNISIFKDMLSKSRLSDLDIFLEFPTWSFKLIERLMVHLLTLIAPYSRQIRSFVLHSRPLRKIFSVLQTIQPLPRLARFQLHFMPEELVDSLDDVFSLGPGDLTLDLSAAINCREVQTAT